jgi:diguanylate cyclase (GGDEF)-like protein
VLVVDADPTIRMLACESLSAIGCIAASASNGREAIEFVDANKVDLILLDVETPDQDGFRTCAELRRRSGTADVPILVATRLLDIENIDRAFEAGATDFVSKPYDWHVLRHRIRFLLRAHEAFLELNHKNAALEASQQRLASAERLAKIGNWEWDTESGEMIWSEEIYRILGLEPTPGTANLSTLLDAIHPADRERIDKAVQSAISEAEGWKLEHRVIGHAEQVSTVHHQADVLPGPDGRAARILGTIQDLTELRSAERQAQYLIDHDGLTGLPNRKRLADHLSRVLARARMGGESVALLCLDLDRFKRVNDVLGHDVGDELLLAVSKRLLDCVRPTDAVSRDGVGDGSVSRFGGDEFTLILGDISNANEAVPVARRVMDVLARPFRIGDHDLVMNATIGIAVGPADGEDAETLLRNAESAMYDAKSRGRGSYHFFDTSMNHLAIRNLKMENSLRDAIERKLFRLHFQPQLDSRSGNVVAIEALVRWTSEEFGPVPPQEFIVLAEELGLIEAIGSWVMREACKEAIHWTRDGFIAPRVAVNVSSRQVQSGGLSELVRQALQESGLPATQLELEVTESALIEDDDAATATLREIHAMGVHIALDDFGTGYSSLSHLIRFPIDTIKIDRSFVARIAGNKPSDNIIPAVTAMANQLNLSVVAEGVETIDQAAFLSEHGCSLLQGYLFAKPMPPEELAAFVDEHGLATQEEQGRDTEPSS